MVRETLNSFDTATAINLHCIECHLTILTDYQNFRYNTRTTMITCISSNMHNLNTHVSHTSLLMTSKERLKRDSPLVITSASLQTFVNFFFSAFWPYYRLPRPRALIPGLLSNQKVGKMPCDKMPNCEW